MTGKFESIVVTKHRLVRLSYNEKPSQVKYFLPVLLVLRECSVAAEYGASILYTGI